MRSRALLWLTAIAMVASIVLGGGTKSGFLSDAALQALSIPLLAAALWHLAVRGTEVRLRWELLFCAALVFVCVLQLVPIPLRWSGWIGDRVVVSSALRLLDREVHWLTTSVLPRETWLALTSLIPPIAVFLSVSLLPPEQRRILSLVVLVAGVATVFLGLIQVAQGESSPLRFFKVTNPTEAVGFFANRNHFAALLCSLTVLAAAWALSASQNAESKGVSNRFEASSILPLAAGFTVLVVLVAAQTTTRSRAGLGLTIVALLGAYALTLPGRSEKRTTQAPRSASSRILIGAITVAVLLGVQFSLYRVMDRFGADPLADARIPFARNTMSAAKAYLPFGSGMGTFVPVYAGSEPPTDLLANTFANRAHNDVLEVWLEAGIVGAALMALYAVWLLVRSYQAWRPAMNGSRFIDQALPRAATLAILLLILHSLVDYPLRTGTMLAIFAFASALLVPPSVGRIAGEAELATSTVDAGSDRAQAPGQYRQTEFARGAPSPASVSWPSVPRTPNVGAGREPRSAIAGERWGADIVWPKEWRQESQSAQTQPTRDPKRNKPADD